MNTNLVAEIAALLLKNVILMTETHSVGPYYEANGNETYVTFDLKGEPVHSFEVTPLAISPYEVDDEVTKDFSPFGAAVTFIAQVGDENAKKAILKKQDLEF